jgi:hypothetical protein
MSRLSISRAWDETREIIGREGKLIGAVALALFVLPSLILDVTMPAAQPKQLPPPGPWIIVAVLAVLASLVGQLAVIRLAMAPQVSVAESIRHGLRRFLPALAAGLLWVLPLAVLSTLLVVSLARDPSKPSVAAAVGLIVLFVAAIYIAVRLILTTAVASAEPIGPVAILKRAWALSAGNWWRLFGFVLLYVIGGSIFLWAIAAMVGLFSTFVLGGVDPLTVGGLVVSIVTHVAAALVSTIFFVMLARLYVDGTRPDAAEVSVPSSGT